MKQFFLILVLSFLFTKAYSQFEKEKNIVDRYYYSGQMEKARWAVDSCRLIVLNGAGYNSVVYGDFLAQYCGFVYHKSGNYQQAEKYYLEGLAIIKEVAGTENFEYANSAINLGDMYREVGLNYKSVQLNNKARQILIKTGQTNTEEFAAATNNLATCYLMMGDYIKSEKLFDTALVLFDTLTKKNPFIAINGKSTIYTNKGAIANQTGDYEKAAFWIGKSFDLIKKVSPKTSPEYNIVLNNYAMALNNLRQRDTAKLYLHRVIDNLEKGKLQNHQLYNISKNNLSEILRLQGKTDSSIFILNEIIATYEREGKTNGKDYLFTLSNLCRDYLQQDSLQKAGIFLDRLLFLTKINNRDADIQLLFDIFLNAIQYYIKTDKYDKAFENVRNSFRLLDTLFKTNFIFLPEQEKLGLIALANESLQLGFAAASGMMNIPDSINTWLFSKLISYRSVLLDETNLLYQKIRQSPDTAIRNLYDEWLSDKSFLNKQYKSADKKITPLTDSLQIITDQLERKLMQQVAIEKVETINAYTISKSLQPAELFIEFVRYPMYNKSTKQYTYHYGAFRISGKTHIPEWVYLTSEKALTSMLNTSAQKALDMKQISKIFTLTKIPGKKADSNLLYATIWKPLLNEKELPRKIYCITDGVLAQLPLHILPNNRGELLADKTSVNYLLSPASLKKSKEQWKFEYSDKISVWGGFNYKGTANAEKPVSNREKLYNPIPGSMVEADNIALLAKQKNISCQLFKKDKGSKANFMDPENSSKDIVHVSAHGYFRPYSLFFEYADKKQFANSFIRKDNPLLTCGLIFSGPDVAGSPDNDPRVLNGYEISLSDFSRTKLIVLSACETGLGSLVGSEGVFGLQRAFRLAGAQKIIISLWQVSDKQTAELMTLFYKNLFTGMDARLSLEAAQHEMRKKYAAYPFYWAGFVLVE